MWDGGREKTVTLETETQVTPPKRRRGRPRKDEADREVRRAEIINAAIKLFAENSYRDTTMSDVAHSLGMNQSSLYYWFKDKEDLLAAILKDNMASTELATMLAKLPGEHPLHLYAVVYSDTLMMCQFPFDYFELETTALAHPDRFKPFFETYRSLRQTIGQIIYDGVQAGDFPSTLQPELSATIVLSIAEGLQHQYHQSVSTSGDALIGVWGGVIAESAQQLARVAADSALNAVLRNVNTDDLFNAAVERGWISLDGGNAS